MSPGRRVGIALATISIGLVMPSGPLSAHDPIVLTDDQRSPATGPLLVDGTVSWAVYAVVADGAPPGDVTVLMPDQARETALAHADLPVLAVERTDGSTVEVGPTIREPFHGFTLSGAAPARMATSPVTTLPVATSPAPTAPVSAPRPTDGTAPPPVIDELIDPADRKPDGPGGWVTALALLGGLGAVVAAFVVVRRRGPRPR